MKSQFPWKINSDTMELSSKIIRLLIVDDHRMVRDGIKIMLESKRGRHTAVIKKLVLPDIEPEDPNRAPLMFGTRPRRRNEVKEETVEVS